MSNNKQSSIEWLIEQVKSKEWQDKFIWHKEDVFQQAKAMHKEEMINFSYKVLNESNDSFNGYVDEEKIYNETFGGEGEN
jgi:predicted HNH restriction endonuclease